MIEKTNRFNSKQWRERERERERKKETTACTIEATTTKGTKTTILTTGKVETRPTKTGGTDNSTTETKITTIPITVWTGAVAWTGAIPNQRHHKEDFCCTEGKG